MSESPSAPIIELRSLTRDGKEITSRINRTLLSDVLAARAGDPLAWYAQQWRAA